MKKFISDKLKKHLKIHKEGKFYCTRCFRKMNGYYTVYLYRTTQAVDGSRAFRVFFICHERNHLSLVGYTKPVDFVLNKGEINNEDAINSRSFAEEEEEEEQEWNEAVEFARRVKDNTKKYF